MRITGDKTTILLLVLSVVVAILAWLTVLISASPVNLISAGFCSGLAFSNVCMWLGGVFE